MVTTVRLYYDAFIAVALMAVVAIICGFVAAVIAGGSPPNFPVAAIAFVLTGASCFSAFGATRNRLRFRPIEPRAGCAALPNWTVIEPTSARGRDPFRVWALGFNHDGNARYRGSSPRPHCWETIRS